MEITIKKSKTVRQKQMRKEYSQNIVKKVGQKREIMNQAVSSLVFGEVWG